MVNAKRPRSIIKLIGSSHIQKTGILSESKFQSILAPRILFHKHIRDLTGQYVSKRDDIKGIYLPPVLHQPSVVTVSSSSTGV